MGHSAEHLPCNRTADSTCQSIRPNCTYKYRELFCRDGTVDYQGRQFDIDFILSPYYGTADLSFDDALQTLSLTYRRTLLYTEVNDGKTTGLDALAIRPADTGFPQSPTADPPLPIPSQSFAHLTLDCEGLVLNADGS